MTFKLLLSTAVWGEDYLEIFLEYTLKSLLSDKNLLCKEISKKSEYLIFAEKKYITLINNHTNLKKIKKIIKIKFKEIKSNNDEKYSKLKQFQNIAIKYGYNNKFDLFSFVYPDSVFGENHFKTLLTKIKKGFKVVLCPGPLGIYEKFFLVFKNKKINNYNLSEFILENLHPFYKLFFKSGIKNNIKIIENKKKQYQLYKCFDLHVAIISLSIKNLKITKSLDEDLLNNQNVFFKDLSYLNHSSEGIIITLESIYSTRSVNSIGKQILLSAMKTEEHKYDIIKYCDNNFTPLRIFNHNNSTFIVSRYNKKKLVIKNESKIIKKYFKIILKEKNINIENKKDIFDQFIEFKKINLAIKCKFIKKIKQDVNWNFEKLLDNLLHYKNDKLLYQFFAVKYTNFIKLSIISLIILFFRIAPKFIKNIIITMKQKNESNLMIDENLSLFKFLLILPNKTIFKLLILKII